MSEKSVGWWFLFLFVAIAVIVAVVGVRPGV